MSSHLSAAAWEAMFAPCDEPTYESVLHLLGPEDIVLDIGAGDLRLSGRMARIARRVYALEINASLLRAGAQTGGPLPRNLIPICADARTLNFPAGITTGVLMMRHCTNFRRYAGKLRSAGACRLITNARWHMSVEAVDLLAQRLPYDSAGVGWYACLCGAAGFKEGPAEQWSPDMDTVQHEVATCPQCRQV
jgi:hypothetical protein